MSDRSKQVVDFLQNLDIKTVRFGGFDREEVFIHFKALSDLYEQERGELMEERNKLLDEQTRLLEERNSFVNQTTQLTYDLQERDRSNAALQASLGEIQEQYVALQSSLGEMQQQYTALQKNMAVSAQAAAAAPRESVSFIDPEQALQQEFLNEFKQYAAEKRQIEKLKEEAEVAREQLKQCRDAIDRILP